MGHGLYLYGIFPPPEPENLEIQGLDKQPVYIHQIENFYFLYSQALQQRYLSSRRNLLGHEKVLEEAMQAGYRTLLPLQFGLVIDDWEKVEKQLIIPHYHELEQLFKKLAGYREVSVKVLWEEKTELQMLLSENQDLKAKRDRLEGKTLSMDETIAIGQEIEFYLKQRRQQIAETFQTDLNLLATETLENDLLMESMIYNAAFLIPWESEPEFAAKIEVLDRKFNERLKIRYNNFTAPYNFAQLSQP
ncbi:MAG: GvpL/GvpF family gas vesicle protein [Desertifilum sp. SIO1I2]|nr:GvpL/GvpF family gas vesicle protein [Desertifilum sp. SIO1I2]